MSVNTYRAGGGCFLSGEVAFELSIYFLIAEEEYSFPEGFVNAKYILYMFLTYL